MAGLDSLRAKLILLLLVFSIAPVGIIGMLEVQRSQRILEERASMTRQNADNAAKRI